MKLSAVIMFVLVALSNNAFAIDETLSDGTCETQKYLASLPNTTLFDYEEADLQKDQYQFDITREIGGCKLNIRWNGRSNGNDYAMVETFASFYSNNVPVYPYTRVSDNNAVPLVKRQAEAKAVMKAFKNALLNCGCTKL